MKADSYHYARQIIRCHLYKLLETPSISCQTLRSVKFICCSSEALAALLRQAPNLTYMDISMYSPISFEGLRFVSISTTTEENQHPSFTSTPTHYFQGIDHPNLRRVRFNFECQTTLKWLDSFLPSTPNITHFNLQIHRSYEVFSFVELSRIITKHLSNLIQHNFRFEYFCLLMEFNLKEHQSIRPLFKTMIAKRFKSSPMRLLRISVNRMEKTKNDNSD